MKNKLLIIFAFIALQTTAQKTTATFEDLLSKKDTFLNGISMAPQLRTFKIDSNGVIFNADYDTSNGGRWRGGFAVSSMTDTMEASFLNLYSSANGEGAKGSEVYLVGNDGDKNPVFETLPALGSTVASIQSLYVTNTTYAYRTMLDGNLFSQKFSASNKDSFVLWIYAENSNNDSMRVDLANFTHNDTTKNFILDSWVKVTIPFSASMLRFKLVSSDNDDIWGINTPAFFAIDQVEVEYTTSLTELNSSEMVLYPNPAKNFIKLAHSLEVKEYIVRDLYGKQVFKLDGSVQKIQLNDLAKGIYILEYHADNQRTGYQRFIKQ